jgi:predicted RNA-binding protein YlqC (UPF0109 family)
MAGDVTKLVTYLVTSLTEYPDDVKVDVKESGNAVRYEVSVNPDDVGKVIGRQGRIIKAIRTVARAAGAVDDRHVDVEILG